MLVVPSIPKGIAAVAGTISAAAGTAVDAAPGTGVAASITEAATRPAHQYRARLQQHQLQRQAQHSTAEHSTAQQHQLHVGAQCSCRFQAG